MRHFFAVTLTVALLFSLNHESNAQSTELGVIIGEPTGVSAKFWTSDRSAVDLGVAWSLGSSGNMHNPSGNMHLHINYLWHFWTNSGVAFYTGLGGRFLFEDETQFAARIPIGLQFNVARRLSLFFELAPTLPIMPETQSNFDINGGAGVRIRF
ncbi:hypothetical protein [Rhodohalobacter sp.]|uniref:hypothetical protein n=1 Tax=Rhodohalobacter sp. TaxID=1974210 RepID=UPI002ACE4367|nr:hypothetical protein [Rhodohalobacter sp.]MDZ7755928.1 hypothetical protein [Rhodohalobacter sp.]MDZ7757176.1 hypothetical protein [Rhodohalobacter sp.]